MRYLLLRPAIPTDPRHLKLENLARLYASFSPVNECDTQEDAAREARSLFPDAVAMPIPLQVGSGGIFVLGLIESVAQRPSPQTDIDRTHIPFVLLVQAVAEHNSDKTEIAKQRQFAEKLWRAPVLMPTQDVTSRQVEVRAGDLANPVRVSAIVGRTNGLLVVRCDVGGVPMSLTFTDPRDRLECDE